MHNNSKCADLSHDTGMDRLDGDLLPGQVQSGGNVDREGRRQEEWQEYHSKWQEKTKSVLQLEEKWILITSNILYLRQKEAVYRKQVTKRQKGGRHKIVNFQC